MNVHADANELREFASHLEKFALELEQSLQTTRHRLHQLNETWQDPEFAQFVESISKTFPVINAFTEDARMKVPSLRTDADIIDEYARLKPL